MNRGTGCSTVHDIWGYERFLYLSFQCHFSYALFLNESVFVIFSNRFLDFATHNEVCGRSSDE